MRLASARRPTSYVTISSVTCVATCCIFTEDTLQSNFRSQFGIIFCSKFGCRRGRRDFPRLFVVDVAEDPRFQRLFVEDAEEDVRFQWLFAEDAKEDVRFLWIFAEDLVF